MPCSRTSHKDVVPGHQARKPWGRRMGGGGEVNCRQLLQPHFATREHRCPAGTARANAMPCTRARWGRSQARQPDGMKGGGGGLHNKLLQLHHARHVGHILQCKSHVPQGRLKCAEPLFGGCAAHLDVSSSSHQAASLSVEESTLRVQCYA
jgi:hypothetical protein